MRQGQVQVPRGRLQRPVVTAACSTATHLKGSWVRSARNVGRVAVTLGLTPALRSANLSVCDEGSAHSLGWLNDSAILAGPVQSLLPAPPTGASSATSWSGWEPARNANSTVMGWGEYRAHLGALDSRLGCDQMLCAVVAD